MRKQLFAYVKTKVQISCAVATQLISVFDSSTYIVQMGLVARKPVFGVADKARLKPVYSAKETS